LTDFINDFEKLDQHLSDKNYIEGAESSLADYAVFINIKAEVDAKLVNATRWYKHIESLQSDFKEQLEISVTIKKEIRARIDVNKTDVNKSTIGMPLKPFVHIACVFSSF